MTTLCIHLFGRFRINYISQRDEIKLTPHAKTLLAFITLHAHRLYPRDVLVDLCWGERSQEQAHACLNTALWRLRRLLSTNEDHHCPFVVTTALGEVGFNWESTHWIDLVHFERSASRLLLVDPLTMQPSEAEELNDTLALFTGDLLEGFYDDWALRAHEHSHLIFLNCLARLMSYHQNQHCYEKSIFYALQILGHDPLREEVHRELMRLYLANGQRSLALRQYQLCCEKLDTELAVAPMQETQFLYQQILAGVTALPPASALPTLPNRGGQQDGDSLAEALRRIEAAMDSLDAIRQDLRFAMQVIEEHKSS